MSLSELPRQDAPEKMPAIRPLGKLFLEDRLHNRPAVASASAHFEHRGAHQLFERYLEHAWRQASESEHAVFLRLLEVEDDKLWHWFMGNDAPTDAELAALVVRIRSIPPGG